MRRVQIGAVSPQKKLMAIARRFGNAGLKFQQGTTKIIYDTLPLDGNTTFRFFEEATSRTFPDTNQQADGNKLPVGSALVVERVYLAIITKTNDIVDGIIELNGLGVQALEVGELELSIANSVVAKNIPQLSMDPRFNKSAQHNSYHNFEFDTQIVIQPLLEFLFTYKVQSYTAIADTFLRLSVEGAGAIISPRKPM